MSEFPGIGQIGNDVVVMRAIECGNESKVKSDEIRGISWYFQKSSEAVTIQNTRGHDAARGTFVGACE
jgi:hypothetical protein